MKTPEFIGSFTNVDAVPKTGLPEFAFCGRSNVGKSTLINFITNVRNLARVSQTPGKTQLINYFLVDDQWHLVDLPGFGFAKVSKEKRFTFQKLNIRNIFCLYRGKALIAACLLFFPLFSQAQLNYMEYLNRKLYFGIMLGFNSSNFKITHSEEFIYDDSVHTVSSSRGPGFNLGIISNLRLSKYFDLRLIPTLSFGGKELNYELINDGVANKPIESISIEFPLEVRFKSQPIKDIRIYVLTGMKYSVDLASNAKARRADDQVKVGRHDLAYELGFGVQFFFPLFIFSPEVKVANGFINIHSRNEALIYSRAIDKLFSRAIIFSIHFEG